MLAGFSSSLKSVKLFCYAYAYLLDIIKTIFACSYTWEYNGKPFEPSGTDDDVVTLTNSGTLVFSKPGAQYSGFYKCKATSVLGVAVSDTVQLISASEFLQSHYI